MSLFATHNICDNICGDSRHIWGNISYPSSQLATTPDTYQSIDYWHIWVYESIETSFTATGNHSWHIRVNGLSAHISPYESIETSLTATGNDSWHSWHIWQRLLTHMSQDNICVAQHITYVTTLIVMCHTHDMSHSRHVTLYWLMMRLLGIWYIDS